MVALGPGLLNTEKLVAWGFKFSNREATILQVHGIGPLSHCYRTRSLGHSGGHPLQIKSMLSCLQHGEDRQRMNSWA
jgi:hypothetical protein